MGTIPADQAGCFWDTIGALAGPVVVMESQRLEATTRDLVDAVLAGGRIEDDRVEAKAQWPVDHRKAARQIAAHANAANGEPIIWVIGLDEGHRQLMKLDDTDPARWWDQVRRCFDEVWPEPFMLSVRIGEDGVMAIRFDTTRAPYVVSRNTSDGGPEFEVPWREGTSVRSAGRRHILRSVVRQAEVPQLGPIGIFARLEREPEPTGERGAHIFVSGEFYLEVREPVDFPEHRWSVTLRLPDPVELPAGITGPTTLAERADGGWGVRRVPTGRVVYVPGSALHADGSDRIFLTGEAWIPHVPDPVEQAELLVTLPVGLSDRATTASVQLRRSSLVRMGYFRADGEVVDARICELQYGTIHVPDYPGQRVSRPASP